MIKNGELQRNGIHTLDVLSTKKESGEIAAFLSIIKSGFRDAICRYRPLVQKNS